MFLPAAVDDWFEVHPVAHVQRRGALGGIHLVARHGQQVHAELADVEGNLPGRLLRLATTALAPGGVLLVVDHDVTNLTEGTGGPPDPAVLYTPESITRSLGGLNVVRAERVRRDRGRGPQAGTGARRQPDGGHERPARPR